MSKLDPDYLEIQKSVLSQHVTYKKKNSNDLAAIGKIAESCLSLLAARAKLKRQGSIKAAKKDYSVFEIGARLSRPLLENHFILNPKEFAKKWAGLVQQLKPGSLVFNYPGLDSVVYTVVQSFACTVDLFQPGSRKTPGTFFEDVAGTLLTVLSGATREYQVSVENETFKIPTDIVLLRKDAKSKIVIPTKITTRERVVQPFAHQRILDGVRSRNSIYLKTQGFSID